MTRVFLHRLYSSARRLPINPYKSQPKPPAKSQPSPETPSPLAPPAPPINSAPPPPRPRPQWRSSIGTVLFVTPQILLFNHLFFTHVFEISSTYGASMLPTIYLSGEWVAINKMCRRGKGVGVGDVVCAKSPIMPEEAVIKRVIGMPGDFVLADGVDTSGRMIQIPQGHCFLAGDNQASSRDSRHYGPVPLALIKGRVIARVLPWKRMSWIESTLTPVDERDLLLWS